MHLDPRLSIIPKRLSGFKHIVLVSSPKGGVGKTTVSVALALILSQERDRVALLDLDINNPTAHIVLGLDLSGSKVEEDKGILPLRILGKNLEFMSIALFTKDKLLPLRGKNASNAIIEILSTVRWSSTAMVVDTPPGFSDEVMEFARLYPRVKYLVISTPDILSILSAQRIVEVIFSEKHEILGVVGNMCRDKQDIEILAKNIATLNVEVLTCIPWINEVHRYYGEPKELINLFKQYLEPVVIKLTR
ncbi:MAG: P-loop NTPase [Ignisphaera sp.]|uniref:ATP-binding protein n=1 Tax=Ignisphaera aggregans TaxID=334771 RepID=A0A7C4NSR7_9CREN